MGASILQRIASGDQKAVADCLDQYSNLVWSIVRRMVPSQVDAEDAVQEVFVDLWKGAARFDPQRASEPAYIAMITRRRMIDRLRTLERRPRTTSMPDDFDLASDHHERIELGVEASLAMKVLQQLKPDQRQAVELSVLHGMSHGEIAEQTSLPLGTVKSYIRRGLATVHESLIQAQAGGEVLS